jgi:hypothetical protein
MRNDFLRIAAGLALAVVPASASACRTAAQMHGYVFSSLPPLQPGEVAARVEIVSVKGPLGRLEIDARIVAMLQGAYSGARLRMTASGGSNCDLPPRAGDVGIVVGRVVASSDDALVIEPNRSPAPDYVR